MQPIKTLIEDYKSNYRLARERDDIFLIIYNDWFKSWKYRDTIAEEIGFRNEDRGFQKVPQAGGGSSFNGLKFNGRAQEMDVLTRWHEFRQDKDFLQFIQDPEIQRISEEFYGITFTKN